MNLGFTAFFFVAAVLWLGPSFFWGDEAVNEISMGWDEEEIIQIRAQSSHPVVLSGVASDVHVSFEIETGMDNEGIPQQNPLNLVFVLDKSGSMTSENKLESSKQAILKTIESLGEQDTIHMVTYGSETEIVFENRNAKDKSLTQLVSRIRTSGMTNLWGGMEEAASLLDKHNKKGEAENRVMLFSDGLVNVGISNSKEIVSRVSSLFVEELDAKVSAYGIGSSFNEDLMKGISVAGQGKYYNIQNSNAISRFVLHSLPAITRPLVYDVNLQVFGMNGASVQEIYGHSVDAGAKLGDIGAENVRTIMASVWIPGLEEEIGISKDVVGYEISYRLRGEDGPRQHRGTLPVKISEDPGVVERGRNEQVIAEALVAETSKIDIQIKEALDEGRIEDAYFMNSKEIEILEMAQSFDHTGNSNAMHLLEGTRASGVLMKKGKMSPSAQKAIHQRGYMKEHPDRQYSSMAFQED